MDSKQFINHVTRELNRSYPNRWVWAKFPLEYSVEIEFPNTGDIVRVTFRSRWKCWDVSGNMADRLENLLNKYVRDDAGNMVPRELVAS